MVYDNQKIRFGYKQYASSELFNNFSAEVWEDFQQSNSDFFSDGILNEQQFLISVASVGSPSYINVGNGVGYSSGNRIYIGSSDTVTYDEHRPIHPQFPQSTGRINIPIPTRDVIHYVWIRHIWTVDPNTSGINRSGSVIYYRWENGYEIKVSTSVTPPGTGYLLIGNVLIRSDNSYSIGYAGRPYINLNVNIYSIDYKSSCFAATTSDINATYDYHTQTFIANSFGVLTVDGVEPSIGQRVLVKNQSTDPEHNGIYVVVDAGSASSNWILQRAADANSSQLITNGMYTFIGSGTTNNNSGWILISPDPITLDTTPLYFDQYGLTSVIGTGNPSELAYWTDTNKINGINTIQWETGSKILHVSNSTLLLESGSFGKYDLHPVFTQATQIVDKQYVDEVVASATQIPGGINTSVQFNDNGTFGGDANLLYDSSILTLTAPIVSVTQGISVTGSLGPGTSAIDITGGSDPGNRALTAIGNSNTYTAVFSSSTHPNVVFILDESTPIDASPYALSVYSSEATGCAIWGKRGLLVDAYGDDINDYGININGNKHYIYGGPLHLDFAAKYQSHPTFIEDEELVDKKYVDDIVASATQIPGGINTSVQFNDNGTFGGDSNLLYDSSILTLTTPIVSVTQGISVTGSLGPGTSAVDITGGSDPGNRALTAIGNSNTYTAVFSSSTHPNVVLIRDESTPINAGHCALIVDSSEATGCGIFGKRGLLVNAYGDGVNDYGISIVGNRHYIAGGPLHLEFAAKYLHHPTFIEDEELVDKKYVDDIVASATQIPGGSDTSIQFNDGGVLGGDSNFTYQKLPGIVSIGTSAPTNGVINIGYRASFGYGLSINVGSANRTAANFINDTSSYAYPTIRVQNLNANGLSALFDGILETNKFRLTTGPVVGSILYASNLYGDASWTTNLLWDQSTNTLQIPSLVVTNGIQIIPAGYGTGPWQWPTTDFSTFESWTNGIPAIVTGCPPDGLTQLAIKVDGVIKIFQTIDLI